MRSNFARAQTNGLTATYTERVGSCSSVSVWGTAQNSRVTAGSAAIGKQLPYIPEGSAYAGYSTLLGATRVGVNVSYIGQTFADDLNLQPLGTAVTAGLYASVPLANGVRLVLQGDNVTDARYLSSIDRLGPPAVISIGVAFPVNKQAPTSCAG
jgi:outer membrane receptor protein involved in Fe transport